MGSTSAGLSLAAQPPAVILMAGLRGAGKTTTAGKLARHLREQHKTSVLVVSTDIYRPAAIQQLKTVAGEVGAHFHPSSADQDPVDIARGALEQARVRFIDVVIVDKIGRASCRERV